MPEVQDGGAPAGPLLRGWIVTDIYAEVTLRDAGRAPLPPTSWPEYERGWDAEHDPDDPEYVDMTAGEARGQ